MAGSTQAINVVLDGPPNLTAGSGRFVEVDTDDGHRIAIGAWTQRSDGPGVSVAERRAPPLQLAPGHQQRPQPVRRDVGTGRVAPPARRVSCRLAGPGTSS
jgi:hypothetical protein